VMVSNLSLRNEYNSGGTEGPPKDLEAWAWGINEVILNWRLVLMCKRLGYLRRWYNLRNHWNLCNSWSSSNLISLKSESHEFLQICASIEMGLAVALDLAPRRGTCLGDMKARGSGRAEDGEEGMKGRRTKMGWRREEGGVAVVFKGGRRPWGRPCIYKGVLEVQCAAGTRLGYVSTLEEVSVDLGWTVSTLDGESYQPSKRTPSKPLSAGKTILKPRVVDLEDSELNAAFLEVLNFFKFQSWQPFISEFRIIYPRLVQEFYMHLECTDEGYKSKVKGIEIDMPIDIAATIFKIPDEGEDYHNFEFNLHEAYTILTGLPADESDLKQTHVRRGPAAVEAPVVQEDQPPVQEDQPPTQEDQPQPSSSMNLETEIPSFSPQPPVHASTSFGGPSVQPELYTFLNDKFDALNTSIQTMSENFELRIQRLENTVSAKFIEQKAASDHATQRFNKLIGTLVDASVELKEHQAELEIVLKGILANSQADVFNTKETLSQISKTRLSFAHLVDDLESIKNLSAHSDEEMSALKKEFKVDTRDLSQGIDLPVWDSVVCEPSSSVVYESSYSLCGLSRRAQFGVVILQLLFELSCSVWCRRAPGVS
ncbi:hypothetical protein Taro_052216, partial [Colocasia esculenta]|nr:hypothetical protein [Colocasia esculenta]